MSLNQIAMVSLEQLVSKSHQYLKFKSLFKFKEVETELLVLESAASYKGYTSVRDKRIVKRQIKTIIY
jgi:hypothetical protein